MIDSSCIIHEVLFIMVVLACVVGGRGKGSKERQTNDGMSENVRHVHGAREGETIKSVTMDYPYCR